MGWLRWHNAQDWPFDPILTNPDTNNDMLLFSLAVSSLVHAADEAIRPLHEIMRRRDEKSLLRVILGYP